MYMDYFFANWVKFEHFKFIVSADEMKFVLNRCTHFLVSDVYNYDVIAEVDRTK